MCSAPKKLYALDDIALWLAGHTIWSSGCAAQLDVPVATLVGGVGPRVVGVACDEHATATEAVAMTTTTIDANTADHLALVQSA